MTQLLALTAEDALRHGYDLSDPATAERWARDIAEGRVVFVPPPPEPEPEPEPVGTCPTCGEPFTSHGGTSSTLVGYLSPPGHKHDDNCLKRHYVCKNGHTTVVSIIRTCPAPGCDWRGKTSCWCCGEKVKAWPSIEGSES